MSNTRPKKTDAQLVEARKLLEQATAAAAAAQTALAALGADATDDQRAEAQKVLDAAQAKVAEAEAAAKALEPQQNTPAAKQEAGGAGNGASPAQEKAPSYVAIEGFRWGGRNYLPGTDFPGDGQPELPRHLADELVRDGQIVPV